MSRKPVGATKRTAKKAGPDSTVLRYLRNIDAKLDRLNKRLDNLSAPRRKRAAGTDEAIDPTNVLIAGTPEHAKRLLKKNPGADMVVTRVPRARDDDD